MTDGWREVTDEEIRDIISRSYSPPASFWDDRKSEDIYASQIISIDIAVCSSSDRKQSCRLECVEYDTCESRLKQGHQRSLEELGVYKRIETIKRLKETRQMPTDVDWL